MIDQFLDILVKIIEAGGYLGVFFLMILESMIFPIPSEAVMPFAGFLWFTGKMSLGLIIIYSTIGSLVGSLISYYIGFYGGRIFVEKYGKYFLLNYKHLIITENFFNKFGSAVFIARFVPIVRHLISIPAGMGKMNIYKFVVYTILGAGMWNSFLTYTGYYLGKNWFKLKEYTMVIDLVLVFILFIFVCWWLQKIYKKRAKK